MNLHFTEASSLAIIDRQVGKIDCISPAQYEIIRQVIYRTGDLEYESLLEFSEAALEKAAAALTALTPIVVDLPDIQVNIVPKLQQTFGNRVYCCATTGTATATKTKVVNGLETLVNSHRQSIVIIGQDETALSTMVELLKSKAIAPSLAIATSPSFVEPDLKQWLVNSSIPYIGIKNSKGGTNVASAIFGSLIQLTWRAYGKERNSTVSNPTR